MTKFDKSHAKARIQQLLTSGLAGIANDFSDDKQLIPVVMQDRPVAEHTADSLCLLLAGSHRRADALKRVTGDNPESLVDGMIDFVNGQTNVCTVWHVSLVCGWMDNDHLEVGRFRLAKLTPVEFEVLRHSFSLPTGVSGLEFPQDLDGWLGTVRGYPGPLVLASREEIGSRDPTGSHHEFFDHLHLIGADHNTFLTFCNFVLGQKQTAGGQFSFDTGPGVSADVKPRLFAAV